MSELKSFIVLYDGKFIRAYEEKGADKVIAELEESHKKEVGQLLIEIAEQKNKINEAQTELELWRDGSIISEAHQKELDGKQHSDYKRCLAMAKLCQWKMGVFIYKEEKSNFYQRWHKRWSMLAEKFKEAK